MGLEEKIRKYCSSGDLSLTKAAEELGISRFKLSFIVSCLGLVWPTVSRPGIHELDGIKDTLKNHAKRHGTTVGAIRWKLGQRYTKPRKKAPITVEEALQFVFLRQSGLSNIDAAKKIGRANSTLRNAVQKYFPLGMSSITREMLIRPSANDPAASRMQNQGDGKIKVTRS